MSRRIIISLAASVLIGIGFMGAISTDASAYYRGGVYRGGVYRGGVRGGVYRGGTTVVYGREWRWASVLLQSVLPRSGLLPPVPTTGLVITALRPRSLVHTGTIIILPTADACPRHKGCNAEGIGRAVASATALWKKLRLTKPLPKKQDAVSGLREKLERSRDSRYRMLGALRRCTTC